MGLYHIHLVRIDDNLIESGKMLQECINTWSFESPPPSVSLNIFEKKKAERLNTVFLKKTNQFSRTVFSP